MSLVPSRKLPLYIAAALGVLIVFAIAVVVAFMWPWIRPSPTHRFPIPPGTILTEPVALEFSKKALAAYGEDSAVMHPLPYNGEGHYFAVNRSDPDSGYVQWTTPQASYGVRVEKEGQQIVCRVHRSK